MDVTQQRSGWGHPRADAPPSEWLDWANDVAPARALGLTCLELSPDVVRFRVPELVPFPLNANGAVNGGFLASAVDLALGTLGGRVAPDGFLVATSALSLHFHRPAYPPLQVVARPLPGGKRVMAIEGAVEDAGGNRCLTALGTMVAIRAE